MLSPSQEADICALLAGAFETGQSGNDLLVAADRMQDDGHPLAEFLRAWHARPARQNRKGWVIGSGRIAGRVTVRLSAVELAGNEAVECELLIESANRERVQTWTADVPLALARALIAQWPEADQRDATRRVESLAAIPGDWRTHAMIVGRAVLDGVAANADR